MGKPLRVTLRMDAYHYCDGCKEMLSYTAFRMLGPFRPMPLCKACEVKAKYAEAMARRDAPQTEEKRDA